MKKVFALVLALVMMLIAGTAFAADPTTGSITVEKNFEGQDYELYKLFEPSYRTHRFYNSNLRILELKLYANHLHV